MINNLDSPIVTATSKMTNACISRLNIVHTRTTILIPKRKNLTVSSFKSFSSCAQPCHSSSSLLLTANLTPPQLSEEWFALRKDKLTTSTFSTALGLWKGNKRYELWHEKVFLESRPAGASKAAHAMEWGVVNESVALEKYKKITGRDVTFLGFCTHPNANFDWMGASPDGLLGGVGILEVKCPFNKGKPELGQPWSTMPFYYMPQIQGQMEIMGRDWVDLYCWTPNGSTIFRVCRDREYWDLMFEILREFWWENVIPAREAVLCRKEDEAKLYKPSSIHSRTRLVISKSIKLAGEATLLCRETAGQIEIFQ